MKEWLPAGTQVAHYEISSRLSANGAGEVYLAQDLRHNREVALKLLPAALINEPSRRVHFLRVIERVATIRHPYLCAVYEGGVTADGRPFVAMEYVVGQSLDSMNFGPQLPINQAVALIVQVADALDALHARGWLHLAIKPTNLMLTRARQVKLLDTGLALALPLTTPQTAWVDLSAARYLSPEQISGEQTDGRADIFSLGAVLYELMTGQPPFAGSTLDEVLAAITLAPPLPLCDLREDVPPKFERVILKALAKDAAERYRTAGEFAQALRQAMGLKPSRSARAQDGMLSVQELRPEQRRGHAVIDLRDEASNKESGQEQLVPGSFWADLRRAWRDFWTGRGQTQTHSAGRIELLRDKSFFADFLLFCRAHWHRLLAIVLALLGVSIAFVILHNILTRAPQPDATTARALQIAPLVNKANVTDAAIVSDGARLVYTMADGAQASLWIKEMKSGEETQLASDKALAYDHPLFAPDGRALYFVKTTADDERGQLYRLTLTGGAEESLNIANVISALSFAPDGKRLAFITASDDGAETRLQVRHDDGTLTTLATRQSPAFFAPSALTWSPDGRVIVCATQDAADELLVKLSAIHVDGASGNAAQTVVADRWTGIERAAWLADGSGLIVAARGLNSRAAQLWRVSYPGGEVAPLVQSLSDYRSVSLTADGRRLISVQRDTLANLWVAPRADANLTQITSEVYDGVDGLAWTPDEQLLYTSLFDGHSTLRLIKTDGRQLRFLSSLPEGGAANYRQPAIAPDGRSLVFTAADARGVRLWRTDLAGQNGTRLGIENAVFHPQFAPNGRGVIYSALRNGRAALIPVTFNGNTEEELLKRGSWRVSFAPDGARFAVNHRSSADGRWQLALFRVNDDVLIGKFDAPGGYDRIVHWTADGTGVSYVVTNAGVSNIWLQPLDGSAPRPLTNFNAQRIFNFAWSRQGQLAVARGWVTSNVVSIQNFK
jgi:serine/threonine protein kinase/Tol biopolymer transport system component